MKKEAYETCRACLCEINSISHEVDILTKQAQAYNTGQNSKAKLYIYADGANTETVLTSKEVNTTMIQILESYAENIKKYMDKLIETLDNEHSSIIKEIGKLDNKILETN